MRKLTYVNQFKLIWIVKQLVESTLEVITPVWQLNRITDDDFLSDNFADTREMLIANRQGQNKLSQIKLIHNDLKRIAKVFECVKLFAVKAVKIKKDQTDDIASVVFCILSALNKNSKAAGQIDNIGQNWSALLDLKLTKK
jgi:hypothetical protein